MCWAGRDTVRYFTKQGPAFVQALLEAVGKIEFMLPSEESNSWASYVTLRVARRSIGWPFRSAERGFSVKQVEEGFRFGFVVLEVGSDLGPFCVLYERLELVDDPDCWVNVSLDGDGDRAEQLSRFGQNPQAYFVSDGSWWNPEKEIQSRIMSILEVKLQQPDFLRLLPPEDQELNEFSGWSWNS